MTNQRKRIIALAAVLLVFLYIAYRGNRSSEITPAVSSADEKFRPIAVENPALRLDLLERLKKLQYTGSRRNIFSSVAAPPPAVAPPKPIAPTPSVPPPVTGPAPLAIPATFYGYVTDDQSGARRAFFMQGEDVYVLAVGEVLLGKYRLVQISNSSAEFEEIGTGRHATLTMEEPNAS